MGRWSVDVCQKSATRLEFIRRASFDTVSRGGRLGDGVVLPDVYSGVLLGCLLIGHPDESQQAGSEEPCGGGDGDGCCLDPWIILAHSPAQKIVF